MFGELDAKQKKQLQMLQDKVEPATKRAEAAPIIENSYGALIRTLETTQAVRRDFMALATNREERVRAEQASDKVEEKQKKGISETLIKKLKGIGVYDIACDDISAEMQKVTLQRGRA